MFFHSLKLSTLFDKGGAVDRERYKVGYRGREREKGRQITSWRGKQDHGWTRLQKIPASLVTCKR